MTTTMHDESQAKARAAGFGPRQPIQPDLLPPALDHPEVDALLVRYRELYARWREHSSEVRGIKESGAAEKQARRADTQDQADALRTGEKAPPADKHVKAHRKRLADLTNARDAYRVAALDVLAELAAAVEEHRDALVKAWSARHAEVAEEIQTVLVNVRRLVDEEATVRHRLRFVARWDGSGKTPRPRELEVDDESGRRTVAQVVDVIDQHIASVPK